MNQIKLIFGMMKIVYMRESIQHVGVLLWNKTISIEFESRKDLTWN